MFSKPFCFAFPKKRKWQNNVIMHMHIFGKRRCFNTCLSEWLHCNSEINTFLRCTCWFLPPKCSLELQNNDQNKRNMMDTFRKHQRNWHDTEKWKHFMNLLKRKLYMTCSIMYQKWNSAESVVPQTSQQKLIDCWPSQFLSAAGPGIQQMKLKSRLPIPPSSFVWVWWLRFCALAH